MRGGIIIWCPSCVTSTNVSIVNCVSAAANVIYECGTDNSNDKYEYGEGYVSFLSATSRRAKTKSNTFHKNNTLRWIFQEVGPIDITANFEQFPFSIGGTETNPNKMGDTISCLCKTNGSASSNGSLRHSTRP